MYSFSLFWGWYFAHFYPYCYLGFSVNQLHRNFLTHWNALTQSVAQRLLHFCSCEVSLQSQWKHHCNIVTCWSKTRCCCKFRWNLPDVFIPNSNLYLCEKFTATCLIVGRTETCRRHTLRKKHKKLLLNLKHLQEKFWFDMYSKMEGLHHQNK